MPKTPTGELRKRIGPTKGRLEECIAQARHVVNEPIQPDLPVNEYEPKRVASDQLLLRIERHIKGLEEMDNQCLKILENLEEGDPEHEQYARVADGPDGYLELIETAKDVVDDLKARITGIERTELRVERSEQASSVAGGSANTSAASVLDNSAPVAAVPQNLHAKMPKLPLPTFSGEVTEWLEFWGQFNKTVHESNLSLQDKFSYLKRCLTGNAASVVEGLAVTEENYITAVDLLKSRYGDEEVLKAILYSQWENQVPVTSHKNYSAIQKLTDCVQKIVRQLASLNDDCEHNSLAIQQYLTKLPRPLRLELENERERNPTLQTFTMSKLLQAVNKWLHVRLKVFQISDTGGRKTEEQQVMNKPRPPFRPQDSNSNSGSASSLTTNSAATPVMKPKTPCVYCGENHFNDRCTRFSTAEERKQKLAEQKRCFLCLQTGHGAKFCPNKSKVFCYHCKKPSNHTRSLCPSKFGTSLSTSSASKTTTSRALSSVAATDTSFLLAPDEYAVFQTATTYVRKPGCNIMSPCRLLLDSASNRTYMLNSLASKLNLVPRKIMDLAVKTFGSGDDTVKMKTEVADVEVFLKNGTTRLLTVNVTESIAGSMIREKLSEHDVHFLHRYPPEAFADTLPVKEDIICPDILIGQAYFWDFIDTESSQTKLPSGLRLVPTSLGLMLGGSAPVFSSANLMSEPSFLSLAKIQTSVATLFSGDTVKGKLKKPAEKDFWSLEMVGITESPVDDAAEVAMEKFQNDIVLEENRYQVCWPWKSPRPLLPHNYGLALGRLRSLLNRLAADPSLMQQYNKNIREQLEKGIIEQVTSESEVGKEVHYLPHHPVVKESSNTTKVRIVYDASAKTNKNANSLNDCLLAGPNLIADLCGMLLRFRLPKVAILADIEKAFLNVGLQMPDRDVCRFLWLEDPMEPKVDNNLVTYRFKRVPFGVVSSPFLLEATLNYHLKQKDSNVNREMIQNTYVDNVFLSANSTEKALEKYKESKGYLAEVSLNLREWVSNDKNFLSQLPAEDKVNQDKVKVLGMTWDLNRDTLCLQNSEISCLPSVLTRRNLLQMVASIFDPLGFWTPATYYGKVLFQNTWKEGISWDSPLPEQFVKEFSEIISHMGMIGSPIRRNVHTPVFSEVVEEKACTALKRPDYSYQLIAFTDASKTAYGVAIYLVISGFNKVCSQLIFSKMRLTPTKQNKKDSDTISLPRLELLGCLLGVRALKYVSEQLKLPLQEIMLYSDSQCVLHWIHSCKPLKTFVQNRVNEIRKFQNVQFQYVPSAENPADLLTRGVASETLVHCELWWNGPKWLCLNHSHWPQQMSLPEISPILSESFQQEFAKETESLTTSAEPTATYPMEMEPERFSSARKLLRTTVVALKFLKKLRKKIQLQPGSILLQVSTSNIISASEMSVAESLWFHRIQQKSYANCLKDMKEKKVCTLQKQLGLFLDQQGLIRCAGRFLIPSGMAQNNLPLLLPRNEFVSRLFVEQAHLKVMHGRVNHTLAELRKRFWIPQGRLFVKQVLNKCKICKRFGCGPFRLPDFATLPKERTESYTPPFRYTGLDYFGPIYTKGEVTNRKVWICLFTCLAVRAVHLEIVYDLSTVEFLAAFQRFCCIQAKTPRKIISDNATQFKLADSVLQFLWNKIPTDPEIAAEFADKGINWTFIPALSPWQGGVYERVVGIIKTALRKALGRKLLKPEQLVTVLCHITHMVNSRPLTYVSAELDDARILCPNDFLHPGHDLSLPQFLSTGNENEGDPDYLPEFNSAANVIGSWKKLGEILEDFWLLWKNHYLTALQERKDYKHPCLKSSVERVPRVGEVVLIKEEGVPRGFWRFAKIVKLNLSKDKECRSAEILTPGQKVLTRPLNLLYPLEILSEDDQNKLKINGFEKQQVLKETTQRNKSNRKAAQQCRERLQTMMKDNAMFIISPGSVMSFAHD